MVPRSLGPLHHGDAFYVEWRLHSLREACLGMEETLKNRIREKILLNLRESQGGTITPGETHRLRAWRTRGGNLPIFFSVHFTTTYTYYYSGSRIDLCARRRSADPTWPPLSHSLPLAGNPRFVKRIRFCTLRSCLRKNPPCVRIRTPEVGENSLAKLP